MSSKGHVILGMSGGLDSSVAAYLLKEEGYKVSGLTLRTCDHISTACLEKQSGCCSVDSIFDAKDLMADLGFDHYVMDVRKEFNDLVISDFIREYLEGRTPNPCVLCNSLIKWTYLLKKADELGAEFVATGHYAQLENKNGKVRLFKGADILKDQSYFLWGLTQSMLKRTIFPIGKFKKNKIREIAGGFGLNRIVEKKESQEICFIPDDNYRKYLENNVPGFHEKYLPGNFVDREGKILGKHNGYPFYTIGQRKGLEVAVGHPLYVTEIRPSTNEVVLGVRVEMSRREMNLRNVNLIKYDEIPDSLAVETKIRYRSLAFPSRIMKRGDNFKIVFQDAVQGITPGQSAVFYEGDEVAGGGIIYFEEK